MERNFYDVTRVKDGFKVSKGGGQIALLECDELEQYGKALLARKGDLGTLYLPTKFGSSINYSKGFVKITDDVEKLIFYKKQEVGEEEFTLSDEGVLLIKVRADDEHGYWTLMEISMFNFDLESEEMAIIRWQNQTVIPYVGRTSEAEILEEFDYLSAEYMLKIDNSVYLVDVSFQFPITKGLGNIQVHPLPMFPGHFKTVSEGLESFECFNQDMSWGQFSSIDGYTSNLAPYTTFYLGKDKDGRVCGMFYNRYIDEEMDDDETNEIDNYLGMVVFDKPAIVVMFQDVIENDTGEYAVWKLLYEDSRDNKLFVCSLTNADKLQLFIDSKYF